MEIKLQLILIACLVNFGSTFAQHFYGTVNQAVISKVNDEGEIQENLQNLFDSIANNDMKTSEIYRKILENEIAKERRTMNTMKEELRTAQSKKFNNRKIFYQKNNNEVPFVAAKREMKENNNQTQQSNTLSREQIPDNDTRSKYTIVMVRHGESEWNLKNLFCGWFDAHLSKKGVEEAKCAGEALKKEGYQFDVAHTSVLTRARETLNLILEELGQSNIPVRQTWRLNERHYGALTGLNKAETALKYGEEQVRIWRRSYDVPPPPMEENHPYYTTIVNDSRYKDEPTSDEFPYFESLKLTIKRTLPYWDDVIVPQIKEGKRILIAAHGNSLRGIVKYLDNMSEDDIMTLNLPTGIPFVYKLDDNLKPVVSLKFLGNEQALAKAMAAVAAQGKAAP